MGELLMRHPLDRDKLVADLETTLGWSLALRGDDPPVGLAERETEIRMGAGVGVVETGQQDEQTHEDQNKVRRPP
jgi:hypothetical protein